MGSQARHGHQSEKVFLMILRCLVTLLLQQGVCWKSNIAGWSPTSQNESDVFLIEVD